MAKRENKTFSIKDLMPQMLKENKLQKGLNQMDVKEAWENVMGKGVKSYTESVYLNGQTIVVKLSSSTLREELNYGKEKIIIMLNEALSKVIIKSIRLV